MKATTFILAIITTFLFACDSRCKYKDCGRNGVCDKGFCECTDGYTGEHCEYETRSYYKGHRYGTLYLPDGDSVDASMVMYNYNPPNDDRVDMICAVLDIGTNPKTQKVFYCEVHTVRDFSSPSPDSGIYHGMWFPNNVKFHYTIQTDTADLEYYFEGR